MYPRLQDFLDLYNVRLNENQHRTLLDNQDLQQMILDSINDAERHPMRSEHLIALANSLPFIVDNYHPGVRQQGGKRRKSRKGSRKSRKGSRKSRKSNRKH
jgi:hypothetical protein